MYNFLVSYFDWYNFLCQNQFGFCQGHSSHHVLITLVNKITQLLDSGDMMIGIVLDLKSIWHSNSQIFWKKYGISGQLINWFKSYLENRSLYVTYNEKKSDIRDVICESHKDLSWDHYYFKFILTILLLSQANCTMFPLLTTLMLSFRETIQGNSLILFTLNLIHYMPGCNQIN